MTRRVGAHGAARAYAPRAMPDVHEAIECEHGATCAGCAHLGEPYARSLEAKRARVADALRGYRALEGVELAPALPADPIVGYRPRVKWMVGPRRELGLYGRDGRHAVVDVPGCRVVSPAIARAGAAVRALLARSAPAGIEALRAVDLRELRDGEPRVIATLGFPRGDVPPSAALAAIAAALRRDAPEVASVFANEVDPRSVQVLGPTTTTVAGADEGWDRAAGVRVLAAPGSFVQAHDGQARAIASRLRARVRSARDALGRAPRVLDLFSGSGTWALAVAAESAEVLAIESFAPAAERIAAAARAAGARVEARAADAEHATRALARDGARFDLVVVNPPRRGLTPGLRAAIAALAPREAAYVSCDPSPLARDLSDLARLGLATHAVTPIDMLPLTDHVEALALLEAAPTPAPIVLATSGAIAYVDKAPHEAPSELARRLAGGAPAACVGPDPTASGVTLVERGAGAGDAAPPARATAIVGAKGVTRKGGTLRTPRGSFRYTRLAVASGHSLLRVECDAGAIAHLDAALARVGHPVLGGARCDTPTRRHFADRHGLDRAFLHVSRVSHGATVAVAPPPPDLAAVAASLGFPEWTGAVGSG